MEETGETEPLESDREENFDCVEDADKPLARGEGAGAIGAVEDDQANESSRSKAENSQTRSLASGHSSSRENAALLFSPLVAASRESLPMPGTAEFLCMTKEQQERMWGKSREQRHQEKLERAERLAREKQERAEERARKKRGREEVQAQQAQERRERRAREKHEREEHRAREKRERAEQVDLKEASKKRKRDT